MFCSNLKTYTHPFQRTDQAVITSGRFIYIYHNLTYGDKVTRSVNMKKLITILVLAAHLNVYADIVHPIYQEIDLDGQKTAFDSAHRMATSFRKERLVAVERETNFALEAMIKRSCKELRDRGFYGAAEKIEKEWKQTYSFQSQKLVAIGDFEPLSDWLSALYITLELLLGKDVMKATHLDDIHILNHEIGRAHV